MTEKTQMLKIPKMSFSSDSVNEDSKRNDEINDSTNDSKNSQCSSNLKFKLTDNNKALLLEKNCSAITYYGIYLPNEMRTDKKDYCVYTDRAEALRFLKQNKGARFKGFTNKDDAISFTECGTPLSHTVNHYKSPSSTAANHNSHNVSISQEKSLFKAPKSQELVKFRKAIEIADFKLVKKYITENPRFLVSSGDTPSILHEGPRYNALHVAAKFNCADIASYILEIVYTSELTNRLYGAQNSNVETERRSKVLLDLYLNTPDKALSETPLHYASKIGSINVVKILLSYSECKRDLLNKYGSTPLDVVCSRATNCLIQNKKAIIQLLKKNYYVPVLRSVDNTIQPMIGDPITLEDCHEISMNKDDLLSSPMKVQALAGPMSEENARCFHKKWKTPPRKLTLDVIRPSLYDSDKGLEIIGRNLAAEYKVQWKEYWSFLDAFISLDSAEGLFMLEAFLRNRVESVAVPLESKVSNKPVVTESMTHTFQNRQNNDIEVIGYKQLSPVSELCEKLSNLTIQDSNCTSEEPLGAAIMCFDKFLEMIAKKLSASMFHIQRIKYEVSKLQKFLTSCAMDEKFDMIDLNRAHYYLSEMVVKYITNTLDSNKIKSEIQMLIHKLQNKEVESNGTGEATCCILSCILNVITCEHNAEVKDYENCSWLRSRSCNCKILVNERKKCRNNSSCKKKLLFNEDDYVQRHIQDTIAEAYEYNTKNHRDDEDVNTDGTEGDTESDEEFVAAESQMESSDEEFFDLPNNTYDIFLAGNHPTKLDTAVLQAISGVNITYQQYPFIYYWKQSCIKQSEVNPTSSWPSPCIKVKHFQHEKFSRELSPCWYR